MGVMNPAELQAASSFIVGQKSIYGIAPSRQPIAAKALANTALGLSDTIIGVVGDSTMAGAIAASPTTYVGARASSPPTILAKLLNTTSLPAQAESWWGDANAVTYGFTIQQYDPRVTLSAGWAGASGVTISGGHPISNSTTTNNLAFTPSIQWDTAYVYYVTNPGQGSFTTQVDGGAVSSAISANTTAGIGRATVSTTLGTHTLNIARTAGSISIAGVEVFNSASPSIRVWNMGWGGSRASDWVSTTNGWSPGNVLGVGNLIPALWFVSLGINEWINAVPVATYQANMSTLITNLKRSGDVVVILPFPTFTGSVPQATQDQYRDAAVAAATAASCDYVDYQDLVGGSYAAAATNGFGDAIDPYHATKAGSAQCGSMLKRAVGRLI